MGQKVGVKSLFFLTSLPNLDNDSSDNVFIERDVLAELSLLACSKDDPSALRFIVIDYANFVCPELEKGIQCQQKQHGFEKILPDGIHPFGDSGLWLTRELLALVVAAIAKYNAPKDITTYSTWDEAFENPISKQLLQLAPPDGNPFLKDIVSTYYVCPYRDLEALEKDFNQKEEEKKRLLSKWP